MYRHFALAEAEKHGVEVIKTRAGDTFRLGRLHLRVLWPNRPGTESEDPNRLAMVILATYGEVDALLTADAETDVTAPLLSRRIEILKVAHHGSADAGLESELRELRPEVAVISCGRGNDYGHHAPRLWPHCARAQGSASTAPTRTGASSSSRTASGSRSGRAVE